MSAIPETLPAFLAHHVNSVTPSLIDRGRTVAFRDLVAESRRIAQGLRGAGVQPGDCVALWLPNVPAWLATFLACAQIGAIAACQVIAIARAEGLIPIAFVILQHGAALDEATIIASLASRLARYKVPRRVVPVEAFHVTPGANATKIQKGKLREIAEALLH